MQFASRFAMLAGLLAVSALACATPAAPTPSPTLPPTASPATTPSPSPTGSPTGAVIATFRVSGEEYRVLVTDPVQMAHARALLNGEEAPTIPNGRVVRGQSSVNTGWSWHIDPDDFHFADMTIELCDGRPSFVERGEVDGDRFCPWGAEVVEIVPAG